MSPGDVMDEILTDPRHPKWRPLSMRDDGSLDAEQDPRHGDDILLWGWIVARIKPEGQQHMPLSPQESERVITMLRIVLDSVLAAKAPHRGHLALVPEGGR